MASFWSRLKELFYNFTQPIQDANMEQIDISDKDFESIALANGVSAEVLKELKNNRNGINISTPTAKSRTRKVVPDVLSNEEVKTEKSRKTQSKNDIEMER